MKPNRTLLASVALAAGLALAAAALAELPASYKGGPYKGKAQVIPGKLQAELYDEGGPEVAYHDVDARNNGSGTLNRGPGELDQFRKDEGVDTSYTKKAFDKTADGKVEPEGDLYVGWTAPGEWVNYTVDVQQAGVYRVGGHMSSNNKDAQISLSVDGADKTGPITIASTGHWHTWRMYDNLAEIRLEKGRRLVTLRFVKEGNMNVDYLEFTLKP
jgi:hypothetical protein